uniref:Uncharacterized protein n=1 Tax=Romanomermis culicivorax TaxID=13658 RepID=A0A915I4A7_ROMCU
MCGVRRTTDAFNGGTIDTVGQKPIIDASPNAGGGGVGAETGAVGGGVGAGTSAGGVGAETGAGGVEGASVDDTIPTKTLPTTLAVVAVVVVVFTTGKKWNCIHDIKKLQKNKINVKKSPMRCGCGGPTKTLPSIAAATCFLATFPDEGDFASHNIRDVDKMVELKSHAQFQYFTSEKS